MSPSVLPVPPTPVPAASLILLRQRQSLEVLVGRRSPRARAFPGVLVFPGGKLEAQDARWPGAEDRGVCAAYAALRETFEETGLLVVGGGPGAPPDADVAGERAAVEAGERGFAELLHTWACAPDLGRLAPFARWITPERAPYRFDTLFFVAEASPAEAGAPLICAEFDELAWARPGRLLAEEGERLMTPTRHCLEALCDARSAGEAVQAARARGLIDGEAVRAAARARSAPLSP